MKEFNCTASLGGRPQFEYAERHAPYLTLFKSVVGPVDRSRIQCLGVAEVVLEMTNKVLVSVFVSTPRDVSQWNMSIVPFPWETLTAVQGHSTSLNSSPQTGRDWSVGLLCRWPVN